MIENTYINLTLESFYKLTPATGYLLVIPADEEEKASAAEYGETVEDYVTNVIYLPYNYDFEANPMRIAAIEKNI